MLPRPLAAADAPMTACPMCRRPTSADTLAEAGWLAPEALARLAAGHPDWQQADGACPACVQEALLYTWLEQGDAALHQAIQHTWPLDARAAFGALPTPLRLHADPRFSGQGVTIAMIDSAFYPHPDLTQPRNRVRAWVDATRRRPVTRRYAPDELVRWPGWQSRQAAQWHGMMTAVTAAGNGHLSHGLYRGLASAAELVLLQTWANGIQDAAIVRALQWVGENAAEFNIRIVNLSLGGEPVVDLRHNPIDAAIAELTGRGLVVVVAAGNDGQRRLTPPATAPTALTIGGLDDHNTFDHAEVALWHSNYGPGDSGRPKPELVAPSIWVVAPLLPGTSVSAEARRLFAQRGAPAAEQRLSELKLVTPDYQHVDGTSFAAPLVSSVVACMLEANPRLTPALVREILIHTAQPVPGVTRERQGAGALEAGRAVAQALREQHAALSDYRPTPYLDRQAVTFVWHDHQAGQVQVLGSWDAWRAPGLRLAAIEPGVWRGVLSLPAPGDYQYKFLVDGAVWLDDPANPHKAWDGYGGFNSYFHIEEGVFTDG